MRLCVFLMVSILSSSGFAAGTFKKSYCSPISYAAAKAHATKFASLQCPRGDAVRKTVWREWTEKSTCGSPDCVTGETQYCASSKFECAN